ncbi:MAG: citrate (Si)-synthase, eukaryotic [Saprospiraceae bacterium]|jgi:citrate synthase|nr:citrate (Si)-synthase, eukaryotic [Saprospiraceae bacterium]
MDPLKEKFYKKSSALKAEIKAIVKEHGEKKVDEVSVEQLIGGMRSVRSMIWDTSSLDPEEGIRFRGYNIPQLRELLPRVPNGREPLPEGLFWLMMVGELPTEEDVRWLSAEWNRRSDVPQHVFDTLRSLPAETHPMTQFSIAVLAMQNESIFAQKYEEGMSKNDYWDVMYEDSMNMIARLPRVAAFIYRRSFKNDEHIAPDPSMDWGGNFAHMLGFESPDFLALMRLYLTIHADHEGGNASAHTMHLVGSTLSDVYYSFSGAMNALAGPLHGLANQEVIKWIFEMVENIGTQRPSKDQIRQYILQTLEEGKVVPGYGHAVLRQPDPRFIAQMRFAQENIKDDAVVQIVWDLYELVPEILGSLGKVKNPYPNVDAHSGALLVHYGLTEYNYYTVLFGVSRALGVCAGLCWDRALGLALERPKSITTDWLKKYLAN